MAAALSESLDKLRKSSELLNAITEEANHTVQSVENFLAKISIGVEGYANVWTDEDTDERCILSYRRVNGRFRIAVTHGTCPDDEVFKAWAECSREEKLETISKLPDLVDNIATQAEESAAKALESVQAVKQVLNKLEN